MAEVVLMDVVKAYGTVVAVDNVSLTMDDGEFVTLVGRGCWTLRAGPSRSAGG